jgi:hypothetical protein
MAAAEVTVRIAGEAESRERKKEEKEEKKKRKEEERRKEEKCQADSSSRFLVVGVTVISMSAMWCILRECLSITVIIIPV